MKILIIGGTGTISSPITLALSKMKEHQIHVLNRGNKKLPTNAKQIIGDGNDEQLLADLHKQEQYDIVINSILYTPSQANIQLNVFKDSITQYIFISTVATYDHEQAVYLNEDSKQGNTYSGYGQDKEACEKIFLSDSNFPITIIRPAQTYSEARIPLSVKGTSCFSVIHRILNDKPVVIHGDGKSTWHSTHADDFAKGFLPLIANKQTIREAYQIINDEFVTWDMIYNHLYKLLGKTPNIVHIPSDFLALSTQYDNKTSILGDKQYSVIYDMSKLKKIVPFQCEIDIKTGLKNYLAYLDNHPDEKNVDKTFDFWCDNIIEAYTKFTSSMKGNF